MRRSEPPCAPVVVSPMRTLPLLLALAAAAAPATGQIPDSTFLPSARADALTGLYLLSDGRVVSVADLRDQVGGRPVLSVTEFASGRARALYPRDSVEFEAGRAWFSHDSVAYRVRFDETSRPARSLTWIEGGRTLTGRRAPMVEREVTIRNGEIVLAGTLILPPGPGRHPVLVYVSGSGPETRRIPRYVADFLAYRGVGVLVTDKRGTGGSTGTWNGLPHDVWATDVEAQLDFLHRQPGVDGTRLGLIGNSEGGYVVPLVAARRSDVRLLVCRVCAALPGPTVLVDFFTGSLKQQGYSDDEVALAIELLSRMQRYALERTGYDTLVAHAQRVSDRPWYRQFVPNRIAAPDARFWDTYRRMLDVDPRAQYARLRIPVLVVLGERDDRILIDKHRAAFDSLARGGVPLTLWVIPEASHGLMLGPGNSAGYPPGLHERLAQWVVGTARARRR